MEKAKRHRNYCLLIFSLVLLFNPNFNVIDPLPDFIAWFLMAKIFERASYCAPHFEEARAGFIRLGWLNLLKIPALMLILFVKSKDTLDNNIYALVSFSFAVFEIILTTQAVNNFFTALFYLGERTNASALISPISTSKKGQYTPETLKNFTYLFFITKTVFYVVPDFFLLTRVSEKGHIIAGSKFYPFVLFVSIALGFSIGTLWLINAKKYASRVHTEDKFYDSLNLLTNEDSLSSIESKVNLRSMLTTLTLLCVTAFLSVEIPFDNWNGINILPSFIYGIMLLVCCFRLTKHTKCQYPLYASGALYSVAAAVHYFATVSFLTKYEYIDLTTDAKAKTFYSFVQTCALIEFFCLCLFLILLLKVLNGFIMKNTGLSPDSDRYHKLEIEFHNSLKIKNFIMVLLGILAGASKCANVFLNSEVQILFSETNAIVASALPWFGVIVTVTSVAYIAFTFFYTSLLKDEVKMKYQSL